MKTWKKKLEELKILHRIGRLNLILWVIFTIVAIGWVFCASFSTSKEIFSDKVLASGFHLNNYVRVMKTYNIAKYFMNSLIYTGFACVGVIVLIAPASYVLANYAFKGRNIIRSAYISTMGIPGIMLMIPLFMIISKLGLNKTPVAIILIYVCTSAPFTIFYLLSFFSTIPKSIQEAALIDGCSHIKAFWRTIFPLAQPGLITVTIFNFISLWNEYMWALVFVNTDRRRTLSLGLQAIVDGMKNSGDWAGLFAAVVIVFVPTFILYILLSEKIMSGITGGAVKG
ncbi:carbohydrate ABC transporter permease [Anaerocolumna xylanovorans]|uniref:N-acetylglucosamine transport system permease protein n=1 Tax=Anaerocolumna xylanovorans DSM 12503 TaxID=1121345 RepID=A0A1M7XXU8_9FIRM|nr:carbohydrate ABC transporter permease [Anaerocolumna xylanovorans]SHO43782.1 N-acetylglucosamine transport system permease protein [Anaerocolumna xylanovorans DSM 12503]